MADEVRSGASPVLVGRGTQLAQLRAAVSNPPSIAVVEGEAGIGKTRLISALRDSQPEGRFLVGAARRIREPFPLGPVIEALRRAGPVVDASTLSPVTGALHSLVPELREHLPPALPSTTEAGIIRHQTFRALKEIIGAAGSVTMILGDLHWADEQSVDFLEYLVAEPPPGLALVVTLRPEGASGRIRAALAAAGDRMSRTEIPLERLAAEDTARLAAVVIGVADVSPRFARELHLRAAGLPMAIGELLALMRARGAFGQDEEPWSYHALDDLEVPVGIRDSVLERAARLDADAKALVEVAGVIEIPTSLTVLQQVARLDDDACAAALDRALEVGLITEQEGRYEFWHVLAAQTIREALPAHRARILHLRAADAVAEHEPERPGRVAHHLAQTGETDRWIDAAATAAEVAVGFGDFTEAVRLLEGVVAMETTAPERRGRHAVTLAAAASEAVGDVGDLTDLLLQVLRTELPQPIRGELRFWTAMLFEHTGRPIEQMYALLGQAVGDLGHDPGLQAWAMTALAIPVLDGRSPEERRHWLDHAQDLIPRIADPGQRHLVRGKLAMLLVGLGDPRWRESVAELRRETGAVPRTHREVNAYYSTAREALYAGQYEAAEQLLGAVRGSAAELTNHRLRFQTAATTAQLDFDQGRWEGLTGRVASLLGEMAEYPHGAVDVEIVVAGLDLALGRISAARRRLPDLLRRLEARSAYDFIPAPLAALILLALSSGDERLIARAREHSRAFIDAMVPVDGWAVGVRALPAVAELCLRDHDPSLPAAADLYERACRHVAGLDAPYAEAALTATQGLLRGADGQARAAASHFADAATAYRRLGNAHHASLWQGRAALAYQDCGLADLAQEHLDSAMSALRALGATWDASRLAEQARARGMKAQAGLRRGRRGYGSHLSPRELEVARLAAAGRANKEIAVELFLSPSTVNKHLMSAMRKLGAGSRFAVAARLAEAEEVSPEQGPDGQRR